MAVSLRLLFKNNVITKCIYKSFHELNICVRFYFIFCPAPTYHEVEPIGILTNEIVLRPLESS